MAIFAPLNLLCSSSINGIIHFEHSKWNTLYTSVLKVVFRVYYGRIIRKGYCCACYSIFQNHLMHRRNNIGPTTDSWGTSQLIFCSESVNSWMRRCKLRWTYHCVPVLSACRKVSAVMLVQELAVGNKQKFLLSRITLPKHIFLLLLRYASPFQ